MRILGIMPCTIGFLPLSFTLVARSLDWIGSLLAVPDKLVGTIRRRHHNFCFGWMIRSSLWLIDPGKTVLLHLSLNPFRKFGHVEK